MLFGLFYSPASIIIIIFYANPLFYANSPTSSSSYFTSIPHFFRPLLPLPPHFPLP